MRCKLQNDEKQSKVDLRITIEQNGLVGESERALF